MPDRIPFHRHRPAGLAPPRRDYDRGADRKEAKRFYASARWRRLRAAFLRENPLCVACRAAGRLTPAEHVHHVKERRDEPGLAFEWSNLEAACPPCHNAKRRAD